MVSLIFYFFKDFFYRSSEKTTNAQTLNCQDTKIIDEIAKQNVRNVIQEVKAKSPTITKLINSGKVKIIGAMHDLQTGQVTFFE